MQVCQAHEQYVRWLLATRDLSPHTIRAYDSDIAAFERHLGIPRSSTRSNETVSSPYRGTAGGRAFLGVDQTTCVGYSRLAEWLQSCRLLESDPWMGATVSVGRSRKLPRILPRTNSIASSSHSGRWLVFSSTRDSDEILPRPHESTTLLAVALMVATACASARW